MRRDKLGWAAKAATRGRFFGSWDEALEAAGSRSRRHPPVSAMAAGADSPRTAQAKRKKLPTNSKAIQTQLPGLYGAALRHFGTYDATLKEAGIDPAEVSQRRAWSRAAVRERLREFELSFGLVSQVMLRRYDSGLLRAVQVWYHTLPAAIKAARIENYSVRGHRASTQQTVCRR